MVAAKKGSAVPVEAPNSIVPKGSLIDEVPFEGTRLAFIDGVIGPQAAGGIVMSVIRCDMYFKKLLGVSFSSFCWQPCKETYQNIPQAPT